MKINIIYPFTLLILLFVLQSCSSSRKSGTNRNDGEIRSTVKLTKKIQAVNIRTKGVAAADVVAFAKTLQGTRYQYGSSNPDKGLDCSGFIWYVFNHYSIKVPRISADFTNAGKEVSIKESMPGDLILFTGSNPKSGVVGHMGLITKNQKNNIEFIHSASGGGKGVMISGMSEYFITRFVKVIRVFDKE